ncbi:DENN/MADD domain containing 6Aa, partial [Tachysurus ichikawai]
MTTKVDIGTRSQTRDHMALITLVGMQAKAKYEKLSLSCLGDTQFCFRFRQAAGRKSSLRCFLDHCDRDAPVCLKKDQGHFYGYVYFRQVRDKTLKRGYFQK